MSETYNSKTYGENLNLHADIILTALEDDVADYVIYSAYETDAVTGDPINNLNDVAIKGKCILIAEAEAFWGNSDSVDYFSPVLENPTWLEVAVHANSAIIATRDRCHVFLEGVRKTGKLNDDGVPYYKFSMGS